MHRTRNGLYPRFCNCEGCHCRDAIKAERRADLRARAAAVVVGGKVVMIHTLGQAVAIVQKLAKELEKKKGELGQVKARVARVTARTLLLGSIRCRCADRRSGAAVSVKPRLRQAQWKVTRTIEVQRAPGGTLYAVQANVDQQRGSRL